jgi:hypothetical protein
MSRAWAENERSLFELRSTRITDDGGEVDRPSVIFEMIKEDNTGLVFPSSSGTLSHPCQAPNPRTAARGCLGKAETRSFLGFCARRHFGEPPASCSHMPSRVAEMLSGKFFLDLSASAREALADGSWLPFHAAGGVAPHGSVDASGKGVADQHEECAVSGTDSSIGMQDSLLTRPVQSTSPTYYLPRYLALA